MLNWLKSLFLILTTPQGHFRFSEVEIVKKNFIKTSLLWSIAGVIGLLTIVLSVKKGLVGSVLPLALFLALVFVVQLIIHPEWLIPTSLIYTVILGPFIMSIKGVPIGLAMDAALFTGFLSISYQNFKKGRKGFYTIPGGIILLIWMGYHLIQFGNPSAPSRVAWFYVMRPAVFYPFLFFLTYHYVSSWKKAILVITFWLVGMTFSTIWGMIQHVFGYFQFEFDYLQAVDAIRLVYIQGRYRIFGTMISPAQFGVAMGILTSFSLIYFILSKRGRKWIVLVIGILALFAMFFSGTRTAIVVIPISVATFVILSKNVKMIAGGAVMAVFLVILMIVPTNNYHIQRMQSAFKTEEDASFKVREQNRKFIAPFILKHPLGGGLGSTGVWGMRFSPWHFLAQFAPDSGYIRVSVELGWIGTILYLTLLAIFFWKAIPVFYHPDPEIKAMGIALYSAMSSILVVEWAQDIVGKIPFNMMFWILMAILLKLAHSKDFKSTQS